MRRRLYLILLCFFIVVTGSGCGKKARSPEETLRFLKDMDTYTSDVEIAFKNQKQNLNYSCREFFNENYGYRLDIGKDRIMIFKGDKIYVKDNVNGETYILEKSFDEFFHLSFVGDFIKLLNTEEDPAYTYKKFDNKEVLLVTLVLPGNNRNMSKAVMTIDKEKCVPLSINVMDEEGNERAVIKYTNFMPYSETGVDLFK